MPASPHRQAALAVALLLALALLPALAATAQDRPARIADVEDPVVRAIELHRAVGGRDAARVVLGRSDAFPDTLAATALTGPDGALLLTDGGPGAPLRPEVAAEVDAILPGTCEDPATGPTVWVAGGDQAVSAAAVDALPDRLCVERLDGPTRVETAIAVADAVPDPSGTVVLARADDWADAGAVGAWAAATRSRVVVTPTGALHPAVEAALTRWDPARVVLVGGEAALSSAVEDQVGALVDDVDRVAGEARDRTAVAIAQQLWGDAAADRVLLAEGYADDAWTTLFAAAPLAAGLSAPILYESAGEPTGASAMHIQGERVTATPIGPIGPEPAPGPTDPPPTEPPGSPDIAAADVALVEVARLDAPTALVARPGTDELWIAERAGRVRALLPDGSTRLVLDIAASVSTSGERGLLGIAIDPAGTRLFTSSNDASGDSVIDRFPIVGDGVRLEERREILRVAQPASNHNGGDLHWGPDGNLWWSLGDGGGSGDTYGNGQRLDTLLASLVRIDVDGGDPYAIPPDNPFAQGGGSPEKWAYGLRNPYRFSFDPATGDLYVADVGQGAVEEVDVLAAGTGAGSNFGWPIFEGTRRNRSGDLPGHVPPVWEELHSDGSCSITGGVVYRGSAIPELHGAYLYTDLCRSSIRAIQVQDGRVVQSGDLGVSVGTPVGFGVDHAGEVLVLSLEGPVVRLVPGG